jgi:hypothetical protein
MFVVGYVSLKMFNNNKKFSHKKVSFITEENKSLPFQSSLSSQQIISQSSLRMSSYTVLKLSM